MSSTKIKSTIKSVRLTTKGRSGPSLTAATATVHDLVGEYVPVLGDTLRITYKSQYPEESYGFKGLRNAVIRIGVRIGLWEKFPYVSFMNEDGKFEQRGGHQWCNLQRTEDFGIRAPVDQWEIVSFEKI